TIARRTASLRSCISAPPVLYVVMVLWRDRTGTRARRVPSLPGGQHRRCTRGAKLAAMNSPFHEVADRVWVSRRPWLDTNVALVAGRDGLLLVDTHGSTAAGQAVVQDVRALGVGEVTAVVNTHWHFD